MNLAEAVTALRDHIKKSGQPPAKAGELMGRTIISRLSKQDLVQLAIDGLVHRVSDQMHHERGSRVRVFAGDGTAQHVSLANSSAEMKSFVVDLLSEEYVVAGQTKTVALLSADDCRAIAASERTIGDGHYRAAANFDALASAVESSRASTVGGLPRGRVEAIFFGDVRTEKLATAR